MLELELEDTRSTKRHKPDERLVESVTRIPGQRLCQFPAMAIPIRKPALSLVLGISTMIVNAMAPELHVHLQATYTQAMRVVVAYTVLVRARRYCVLRENLYSVLRE
jgi:hypothetical protein